MIELMVKTGKLDKELWENHRVIVSEAFLKSLEPAYEKRNNKVITIDEIKKIFENGGKNMVSDTGNPVNVDGNTAENDIDVVSGVDKPQSKVNKSKVNKSKVSGDSDESQKDEKPIALLSREPKNDMERVNKKWLENYIALHGSQPVNPSWNISAPRVSKAIKQVGIEKILQTLDTAMKDEFCLKSGYILKTMMATNVISKLVNKPLESVHPKGLDEKKSLKGLESWN